MLDIKLIRERPEFVKENLAKRKKIVPIDELIEIDKKWRNCIIELDKQRTLRNRSSEEIAKLKSEKKDASEKIKQMKEIVTTIEKLENELETLEEKRNSLMLSIPNLIHDSVPIGKDESENVELRRWGVLKKPDFNIKSHTDILEELDLADIERAARATGARFYYLKNELFRMGIALETFTIDYLTKKGFIPMETPFMLKRDAIQGAVALSDFEDVIYKIENEDLYLIGTAEHTLLAYHMGEIFEQKELPKLYVGFSTNFRKEAGAHGKDMKGIYRVHQFDKVEQFIFCRPEDSWHWHEELVKNAEGLYQLLKIPYRIVVLCTGDLGTVPAKTYDLEAWMPAQNEYREMVSASNCTDYQARRLNIRYRTPKGTKFVHTLNSTAIAIQRTLVSIVENYQQKDGSIVVPEVLRPYMGGSERIRRKR